MDIEESKIKNTLENTFNWKQSQLNEMKQKFDKKFQKQNKAIETSQQELIKLYTLVLKQADLILRLQRGDFSNGIKKITIG